MYNINTQISKVIYDFPFPLHVVSYFIWNLFIFLNQKYP